MNPATDIAFAQGPMDVLDHSCSKLGFGGKMCIDGTKKFEEETDERYATDQEMFLPDNDWLTGISRNKSGKSSVAGKRNTLSDRRRIKNA